MVFCLLILPAVFTTACRQDESEADPIDAEKPSIVVVEPLAGDSFDIAAGPVHIKFLTADNDRLSRLIVRVRDLSDSIWFQQALDTSVASFSYHEHFLVDTAKVHSPRALKLQISSADYTGNLSVRTVPFYIYR